MEDGRIVAQGDTATVLAEAAETGSTPNVFRAVYANGDRATIAGGAAIQLPRPGSPGAAVWCRLPSGAVSLGAVDETDGASARNRIAGLVVAVDETAWRVRVSVDVGVVLHADVTPESARRLTDDHGLVQLHPAPATRVPNEVAIGYGAMLL